jgi:hypothetical protein
VRSTVLASPASRSDCARHPGHEARGWPKTMPPRAAGDVNKVRGVGEHGLHANPEPVTNRPSRHCDLVLFETTAGAQPFAGNVDPFSAA